MALQMGDPPPAPTPFVCVQDLLSSVKETQGADFMASQQEAQQCQEQIALRQQEHSLACDDEQAKEHAFKWVDCS